MSWLTQQRGYKNINTKQRCPSNSSTKSIDWLTSTFLMPPLPPSLNTSHTNPHHCSTPQGTKVTSHATQVAARKSKHDCYKGCFPPTPSALVLQAQTMAWLPSPLDEQPTCLHDCILTPLILTLRMVAECSPITAKFHMMLTPKIRINRINNKKNVCESFK